MTAASLYSLNWDLDSILPNPQTPAFSAHLDQFKVDLTALADASDQLPAITAAGAAAVWGPFVETLSTTLARNEDLNAFVGCHSAVDAENKEYQRVEGVLASLSPLRQRVLANVELAFSGVEPAAFERFISGDASLQKLKFVLEECRRNAALRLPKEQEQLANELAVDGAMAWSRLYDRLSGELRVEVMERGVVVKKSPGQVQFDMPERSVRQNNFYAFSKAWATLADTCADALNHLSGARLTKYKRLGVDHLAAPLRLNRMTRETLDAMWGTINDKRHCLLPYLDRKAKLMGLPKLAMYDLFAPLPTSLGEKPQSELSYPEAVDLVSETFTQFSPDLGDFAKHAFREKWVEAENRGGKRQGAFCTGIPTKKQTRVFMTYTGSADSMSTLAHELGHAYHSWVLREQPFLLQDYPMNLAETASTFAEAVVGEKRLAAASSVNEELGMLDQMLGDSVAFLMNIHSRFVFEDRFHIARAKGELTPAELSELMLTAQKETYLNALADDGWYPDFWISKLHFYIHGWPFYNFPYTFGYLLSNGLYSMAAEGDPQFPERYRKFLIATGCQLTEDAVQSSLGYDLRKPDFWARSIEVIAKRVERFVKLADQVLKA
jgi:pepF/M3 family oligoendopeptidase